MGGLFVVYNANYLFTESSAALRYENLAQIGVSAYRLESGFVPKFTCDGRLISKCGDDYPWVLFRKARDSEASVQHAREITHRVEVRAPPVVRHSQSESTYIARLLDLISLEDWFESASAQKTDNKSGF